MVTLGHRNPSGAENPPEWKAIPQNGCVWFAEGWGAEGDGKVKMGKMSAYVKDGCTA